MHPHSLVHSLLITICKWRPQSAWLGSKNSFCWQQFSCVLFLGVASLFLPVTEWNGSLLAEHIHPHSSDIAWISQFILPSFLRVTFHCIPKTKDPWGWSAKTLTGGRQSSRKLAVQSPSATRWFKQNTWPPLDVAGAHLSPPCVSLPVVTRSTWAWHDEDTVAGCSCQQTSWVLSLDPQFMSLSIPLQLSQFCCLEGQAVFAKKEVVVTTLWLSPGAIRNSSICQARGREECERKQYQKCAL